MGRDEGREEGAREERDEGRGGEMGSDNFSRQRICEKYYCTHCM